ncbi:hypothetical protein NE865_02650 [Phthorimaea operculella]|nr:hypothetical protein NE865_02650 [Phthorimaea operculella]
MYRNDILLAALVLLCCASFAISQSVNDPVLSEGLNPQNASEELSQRRRCFQFTWLGPRYHNDSVFMNATCADATRLTKGIPCQQPLVVSFDGTWPDVEYIWRYHAQQASCVLADNDVCAQYTYYFNGKAENSTYMCTRAMNKEGAAITSGCYKEVKGSAMTKVCFCRSVPGGVPCNSAILNSTVSTFVIISAVALVIKSSFVNLFNKI